MSGFDGYFFRQQAVACYAYAANVLSYTPYFTMTASQHTLKNYKIPKYLKKRKKFECTACQKTIEGVKQYASHLNGKLHLKNVGKTTANPPSTNTLREDNAAYISPLASSYNSPRKSSKEYVPLPNGHVKCSLCNVVCNSRESMRIHNIGLKHKKNLTNSTLVKSTLDPTKENPIGPNTSSSVTLSKKFDFTKYLGHEFVKAERNEKGVTGFYECSLCSCKVTSIKGVTSHLGGRKHRQKYKLQVDSSVVIEPKNLKRTEKKKRDKQAKEKAKEEFWKKNNDHLESKNTKRTSKSIIKSPPNIKDFRRSIDDIYLLKKYEVVGKDPEELQALLWLCDSCENALKMVSDEFLERGGYSADDERRRLLKGTMRVGVLCNMQIIKEDTDFRLILLLSTKPTLSLLEMIYHSFRSHFKTEVESHSNKCPMDYKVIRVTEAACIMVTVASPFKFNICISVTSQLYDEEATAIVKEERDVLCPDSCKESLQQLRRADWFQARAKCLNEGLKVLRVLRHLRLENYVWSLISEWATELLIEKCTFVQGLNASPSDILRCYLELLSSGLLFDGPGLQDPCECQPLDLLKDLTPQERENITRHAQRCLRILTFEQSYEFLNIPKSDPVKRKLSSNDEVTSEKRQKLA